MAARITRAKKKIAAAGIPYRVPPAEELPDRIDAVLEVVHLLYTTGHTAPTGDDLVRRDLVERALDLARMLRMLLPTAVHDEAPTYADTDWREIVGLYDLLVQVWPSPVVALNRAVAIGLADGPALEALADEPQLAGYAARPVNPAEGELVERCRTVPAFGRRGRSRCLPWLTTYQFSALTSLRAPRSTTSSLPRSVGGG